MSRRRSSRARIVVSTCLGAALGCAVEDEGSEPLEAIEHVTRAPGDLRAAPEVEVLDGVAVVVPPPGMQVSLEVIYEDGQMELVDVSTDADGRVALVYPDEEWGLVAPTPSTNVCPGDCVDDRMSLRGWHWVGALPWRYRDAGRPAALTKAAVIDAFIDGAAGPPSARDGCGLADNVGASHSYQGETASTPDIGTGGGMVTCGSFDTSNVIGWADLPSNILGVTCTWSALGVAAGTDMLYDNVHGWYTGNVAPAGCTGQLSLRGVALHEFGHAFGLGHSPGDSCNLTMYPSAWPCNDGQRYFGLGDVMGLEAVY